MHCHIIAVIYLQIIYKIIKEEQCFPMSKFRIRNRNQIVPPFLSVFSVFLYNAAAFRCKLPPAFHIDVYNDLIALCLIKTFSRFLNTYIRK